MQFSRFLVITVITNCACRRRQPDGQLNDECAPEPFNEKYLSFERCRRRSVFIFSRLSLRSVATAERVYYCLIF